MTGRQLIPPILLNGHGATIGRLKRFASWLSENPGKAIEASVVYLTDERNWVWFHDGRHRFAVLRDIGYRTIKVAVRREQAAQFHEHFAPEARKRKPGRISRPPPNSIFWMSGKLLFVARETPVGKPLIFEP
jgi:hypothetical protein